jgi:hypothetical protein
MSLQSSGYQTQSHCVTDGQLVCLGVEPNLGLMARYLWTLVDSYGPVLSGAVSDERSGLSFASQSLKSLSGKTDHLPHNCIEAKSARNIHLH